MIDHCLKSHLFALPVCNVDVVDDVVVLPIFARLLVVPDEVKLHGENCF